MSAATNIAERRTDPRFDLELPVRAQLGKRQLDLRASDLSIGGACLTGADAKALRVGQEVEVELPLPDGGTAIRAVAEVRWVASTGARAGVRFAAAARLALAGCIAALVALNPMSAQANENIPTFDPQADQVIEGRSAAPNAGARPDEYAITQAFENQFAQLDRCVAQAKGEQDETLEGDAQMQILLNPQGQRPLGINASVDGPMAENGELVDCLRAATGSAPFPAYDGPPIVVDLGFELDAGYEIED